MPFNYNQLPFGEKNEHINTVIEIPKGSMMKIEWDRKKEIMVLDRVEPGIFAKPCNYGFIPGTLDEDGDELDTLVITEEPLPTGVVVQEAVVLGVLNFEDDGEMDHKIICAPSDDRHEGKKTTLDDLNDKLKEQIEHHFNHYKDLKKPGTTKVLGYGVAGEAWSVIEECIERMNQETKE